MYATALCQVLELLGDDFKECQSPSLRLEKFVRIGDNQKGPEIQSVVTCEKNHASPIPAFCPKGAEQFVAKLESRLIVNQAGGILENAGMCLHPHFGSPYIPGSAVKGVARHAAWCEWDDEAEPKKKEALAKDIARVFGYPTGDKGLDDSIEAENCSGSVAFLAAVPKDKPPELVVDIVNNHHRQYYSPKNPIPFALDNEEPNPQFFPAVKSDSQFIFTLVPIHGLGQDDISLAKKWLINAVTAYGIGAKTAAGYGWFSYTDYKSVEPDQNILERCHELSQTKLKALFKDQDHRFDNPSAQCALYRTVLSAGWWKREKTDPGSKITKLMEVWESKFGKGE